MSASFPSFRIFSGIISSNKLSASFLSFWNSYMQMLHLMLSISSLNLVSFFIILFLFLLFILVALWYSVRSLINSSVSTNLLLITSRVLFTFQLLSSLCLIGSFFLCLLSLCWRSHWILYCSLKCSKCLYNNTLNLLSGILLISVSVSPFFGVIFVLFFHLGYLPLFPNFV